MTGPRVFTMGDNDTRSIGERGLVQWTPGVWWVVEVTGQDGSFTPLYRGQGSTSVARKADAANHMQGAA